MKCIKKDGVVRRVSDHIAEVQVQEGWEYCPKSEYKAFVSSQVMCEHITKKPENKPEISSEWFEVALDSVGVKRE